MNGVSGEFCPGASREHVRACPCSSMDRTSVSETDDPGSIPGEGTKTELNGFFKTKTALVEAAFAIAIVLKCAPYEPLHLF